MTLYALWTVAFALVLMWLLGVCGTLNTGAWIHVLLIAAVAIIASSVFSRPHAV